MISIAEDGIAEQRGQVGRHLRLKWILAVLVFLILVAGGAAFRFLERAQPMLRDLIVQSLEQRFHGRVELGALYVSLGPTIQVAGEDLKIFGPEDANPTEPGIQPLIETKGFRSSVRIFDLLHSPIHVHRVYLLGLHVNIPPTGHRPTIKGLSVKKVRLQIDELACDDARLTINTLKPGKAPIEFAINQLRMSDIGPQRPSQFEATIVNPKPVGRIDSSGLFGPWELEDVRRTPVQGQYWFSNADLSTISGLAGTLSSNGEYQGTLGNISVEGATSTADFRLTMNDRSVPLATKFQAIVDGTTGDVTLQNVDARMLNSKFTAKGSIVRVKDPPGHRIELKVWSSSSRIDDLLKMSVRSDPPVMVGAAGFNARVKISPGTAAVIDRLQIEGKFEVSDAHFTNDKIQSRVDSLSLRSQGKPKEVKEPHESIASKMEGAFTLASRVLIFRELHFEVPGTQVAMTGKYSLDGNLFDFHGRATIEAKPSQTVTGWKSALLKPLDPFLDKHGQGTRIPISVTGTKSEPHIGLDFGHKAKPAEK
jgi:AsmA-like C-terminal region